VCRIWCYEPADASSFDINPSNWNVIYTVWVSVYVLTVYGKSFYSVESIHTSEDTFRNGSFGASRDRDPQSPIPEPPNP
jgi:hypothetical protein